MFFVYILKSQKNGAYYIGSCDGEVSARLCKHNKGRVKSTRRYIPWKVTHTEKFKTRRDARQRESQIKSWKSRGAIERLIKKHSQFS